MLALEVVVSLGFARWVIGFGLMLLYTVVGVVVGEVGEVG